MDMENQLITVHKNYIYRHKTHIKVTLHVCFICKVDLLMRTAHRQISMDCYFALNQKDLFELIPLPPPSDPFFLNYYFIQ